MGLADVHLSIRVLRGQLQTTMTTTAEREEVRSLVWSVSVLGGGLDASSSHLSQRGFALEKVCVFAALRRAEFGVEEGAAVGDGLQGGGTLVGKGQTHKQLRRGEI